MDFYLATCRQVNYGGYLTEKLHLIDIGKPETLAKAEGFLYQNAEIKILKEAKRPLSFYVTKY